MIFYAKSSSHLRSPLMTLPSETFIALKLINDTLLFYTKSSSPLTQIVCIYFRYCNDIFIHIRCVLRQNVILNLSWHSLWRDVHKYPAILWHLRNVHHPHTCGESKKKQPKYRRNKWKSLRWSIFIFQTHVPFRKLKQNKISSTYKKSSRRLISPQTSR